MKKRHYTPHQKEQALLTLQEHDGDTTLVSRLFNIPSRTLYDWRKNHEASHKSQIPQENLVPPPPQIPQIPQIPQSPQLPPLELSAFGVTRERLMEALEIEYIASPFNDMRESFMKDITALQASISEDPDLAHVRVLAVSRMLDDVLRLEPYCRLEKPTVNIIKYEYPDNTFHDIPEWSNAVYHRADQAFHAVLMQARREYYALKGEVYEPHSYPSPEGQSYTELDEPTLEELAQMHFTIEDFIPQHTGILAWALNRDLPTNQSSEYSYTDDTFFGED